MLLLSISVQYYPVLVVVLVLIADMLSCYHTSYENKEEALKRMSSLSSEDV